MVLILTQALPMIHRERSGAIGDSRGYKDAG